MLRLYLTGGSLCNNMLLLYCSIEEFTNAVPQFPFLLRPVLNPSHQRHHFLMNRSISVKLIIEGETRGSLVGGRHLVPL